MQRFPHRPRFDHLCRQGTNEISASNARKSGIQRACAEPACGVTPFRFRHPANRFYIGQPFLIAEKNGAPRQYALGQHFNLPAADAGENVAHSIIEADLRMFVVLSRISRLSREKSGFLYGIRVIRYEHAAARGRYYLVSVE